MNEFRIDNDDEVRRKLGFLYKKSSMKPIAMSYWMTVPEFLEDVMTLYERREVIDDAALLTIVARIYSEKKEESLGFEKRIDFNFRAARQGINNLKKALENESSHTSKTV